LLDDKKKMRGGPGNAIGMKGESGKHQGMRKGGRWKAVKGK